MLAGRAPSVHNTQPWMWRVGEHSLHLYANWDLNLPHTDPDARDLMVSCGAALNHCVGLTRAAQRNLDDAAAYLSPAGASGR